MPRILVLWGLWPATFRMLLLLCGEVCARLLRASVGALRLELHLTCGGKGTLAVSGVRRLPREGGAFIEGGEARRLCGR